MNPDRATPRGRRGKGIDVRPESIREARSQARLTMAQLAGSELTRGAIYLFETGRARPSRETLGLIAARTAKPVSFFLNDAESVGLAAASATGLGKLADLLASGASGQALELAERLLGSAVDPLTEAEIRLAAAQALIGTGRWEAALTSARHAHRLASGDDRDEWVAAKARLVEARALQCAGDPSALGVAREALAAVRRQTPPPVWVEEQLLHLIGTLEAQRGEWAAAAQAHGEVVRRRATAKALDQAVETLEAAAERLTKQGRATSATAIYWSAATLRDVRDRIARGIESAVELGRAQWQLGEREAALRSLEDAAHLAEIQGLEAQRAYALLGLAELALQQGPAEQAQGRVEEALAAAAGSGDRRMLGVAHLLRGRLAASAGDHAVADAEFGQALRDLEAGGSLDRLLEARAAYADVLEASGRTKEAMEQWKLAVGLSRPDVLRRLQTVATPARPRRRAATSKTT
jgi:tetratricopeptide (TPR) repeat protein